jgi:hypothetical protein
MKRWLRVAKKGRRKPHRPQEAESNRADAELASQLASVIEQAEHLAQLIAEVVENPLFGE